MGSDPAATTLTFTLASVRVLPLRGASGVTGSAAGVLLVEDDLGIYRLRGATATLWAGPDVHEALGDLEGITASEDGRRVWVLSEEGGTLIELRVGARRPRVNRTARLARPGSTKNKGFEGLAFAPGRLSPTGRDAIIAVHEHKPRRVCVFDARTWQQTHDLKLPPAAKAVLDDLADVAVDPRSGRLLLLSEQSRRLGLVRVEGEALELESTFDLPLTGDERPEGLAFLSPSRLVVVTEGPARMLVFRVGRRRARE